MNEVRPVPQRPRLSARVTTAAWKRLRRLIFPLLVALPPLFWVLDGMRRVTLVTLGRDQGIFQYVAWAVRAGAKDYRDVRDVNGPLIHAIHVVFQSLGGSDEHRFRELDLLVSAIAFAGVGACLAGLGARPRRPALYPRAPRWFERVAWAGAAAVVLGGQYLLYLYWDLAQRESFCDWFALAALGLQLAAQARWSSSQAPLREAASRGGRTRLALVAAAGLLSVVPWFGKPTFVLFSIVQLATLVVDGDMGISRRRRVGAFVAGGVVGATSQLAYLVRFADVRAFARIYFHDVPVMYRFIWPKSASEIFAQNGNTSVAALAIVTSLVLLALIADGQMPRRALALALFPVVGLGSVLLQKKGFPYHFHPVTAGYHLQWLALAVWFGERFDLSPRRRSFARFAPIAVASALALRVTTDLQLSPHIQNVWILEKGETPELRATRDFLVYFRDRDFFPWEMRQAAEYLRAHTAPSDRVQLYGMDPYVLFLAQRMSATPYIYAYDLNADAALNGGFSLYPNDEESWRINMLRDEHVADMFSRLEREPPAAFVFIDNAPLISTADARADFTEHCPKIASWVASRYRPAADFGEFHILLRNDFAGGIADSVDSRHHD